MTPDVATIVRGLTEAQKRAIREAEPWGAVWWLPYTPGEEAIEAAHIFRFASAQFTDLGLAVRAHLLENKP